MQAAAVSVLLASSLAFACAQGDRPQAARRRAPNTTATHLEMGHFYIKPIPPITAGAHRYLAAADSTCAFEIELGSVRSTQSPFAFTTAALVRRPSTDCTRFLRDLAVILQFKGQLPAPRRQQQLDANVAILGTNQSRSPLGRNLGGSFASDPPGSWTATKLFVANGEGEVYLNLNATDGIGEFSIKEADYATTVVTELAKVLRPL